MKNVTLKTAEKRQYARTSQNFTSRPAPARTRTTPSPRPAAEAGESLLTSTEIAAGTFPPACLRASRLRGPVPADARQPTACACPTLTAWWSSCWRLVARASRVPACATGRFSDRRLGALGTRPFFRCANRATRSPRSRGCMALPRLDPQARMALLAVPDTHMVTGMPREARGERPRVPASPKVTRWPIVCRQAGTARLSKKVARLFVPGTSWRHSIEHSERRCVAGELQEFLGFRNGLEIIGLRAAGDDDQGGGPRRSQCRPLRACRRVDHHKINPVSARCFQGHG